MPVVHRKSSPHLVWVTTDPFGLFHPWGKVSRMQNITVLSGGMGGARFLRGLLHGIRRGALPGVAADAEVTVVANTADDLWVHGLKVCPDLDTVMYTLGDGIDPDRGWGRRDETWSAKDELAAYGVEPTWFGLGDRDIATHLVRTQMLDAGYPLSEVTAALCRRWQPGVRLLPMTDDRVETHVAIADPDVAERPAGRALPGVLGPAARRGAGRGRARASASRSRRPRPGVIDAITDADLVLAPAVQPGRLRRHHPRRARASARRSRRPAPRSSASPPSSAAPTCAAWPTRC